MNVDDHDYDHDHVDEKPFSADPSESAAIYPRGELWYPCPDEA